MHIATELRMEKSSLRNSYSRNDYWGNYEGIALCYLMEVAGTSSLQELFVSTHRDAERVDHFVAEVLCCGDDVPVLSEQVLYLRLEKNTNQSVNCKCCDVFNDSPQENKPTTLRDLTPSTGRWKPMPKDFTTTRMLLRDSLRRKSESAI